MVQGPRQTREEGMVWLRAQRSRQRNMVDDCPEEPGLRRMVTGFF